MKITKGKRSIRASRIYADAFIDEPRSDIAETIDDLADDLNEIQDDIEDIQEDDVDIELDNNIDNHYIAECDNCHGVFISALAETDQEVESISGICPLCDKESNQYLKWIIKQV